MGKSKVISLIIITVSVIFIIFGVYSQIKGFEDDKSITKIMEDIDE
jgi:cell division protein FtsL